MAGIAHQTARSSGSVGGFIDAFGGRLSSLGRAHEILTAATWERAPLRALIAELLGPYLNGAEPQVTITGPDVLLGPRQLISLSMIVHELLTNAVKYGALSQSTGDIALVWTCDDGQLALDWIEMGLKDLVPPTRKGFGPKMIARSVAHGLRGRERTEWRVDGMTFNLSFPLTEEVSCWDDDRRRTSAGGRRNLPARA